jgi:ATP dependent DNA ligase-like protein
VLFLNRFLIRSFRCCGDDGVPSFDRIRYRRHDGEVFLYAFDLIELDGDDLRRAPLDVRKATLASLLRRAAPGLRLNEHIEADGPTVFAHACKLGLEGIVSKRKGLPYRSGRSPDWLKMKNPACAVGKKRGGGGLGTVTHREYLAQVDRFFAECKNRIVRQREIIAYENNYATALEENPTATILLPN